MSEIRVNSVVDEAGTGAVELTQGATIPSGKTLSGAGAINVTGSVTAATGSFTGNVSVGGTLTYEDVTNVDSVGIITARSNLYVAGETRTTTIAEKSTRVDGNTATLTYAGSSANVAICTNPSGNITLNVLGIPDDSSFDNHTLTFAVIVNSTGTARTCTAVTLNGVSKTIKWAGTSLENALSGVTTTNGYTVHSFSGINTVGSASTTANYEVFGVVSGGFF